MGNIYLLIEPGVLLCFSIQIVPPDHASKDELLLTPHSLLALPAKCNPDRKNIHLPYKSHHLIDA
jgi:hypothetical protein